MYNRPLKRSYTLLQDAQSVSVGNLRIRGILTPGHTVGSTSYLVNDRYLFVGDTLSLMGGRVHTFPFFINMDTKTQKESIKKLAGLSGVEMIFTAHTGYCEEFEKAFEKWRQ